MAIAKDTFFLHAAAETADYNFSFSPVGTPRGIIVGIESSATATETVTVTYGGVTMAEVALSPLSGDFGGGDANVVIYTFFLGASIPSGTQTVSVDKSGTQSFNRTGVWSVTAAQNTEVVDTSTIASNNLGSPTATLSLGGNSCFCAETLRSGHAAVTDIAPLSGWTGDAEFDNSASQIAFYSYDTIGTADVTMGWDQVADNAYAIGIAIKESAGGGLVVPVFRRHYQNLQGR